MPTRVVAKKDLDPGAFEAVLDALAQDLARRHYSEALIEHTQHAGQLLFAYLREKSVRDLRAVTDAHVTAYARHLGQARSSRGTPFSVSTQRWLLSSIQRLFRFLEERGVILHNPALDLELPSWRRLPRAVLHQEQARRLMAHPDPHTPRGKRAAPSWSCSTAPASVSASASGWTSATWASARASSSFATARGSAIAWSL